MHHKQLMMRGKSNGNSKVVSANTQKPTREPRVLPTPETYSLHIRVRAFAVFGDETVDPRGDQRAAVPSRARAWHRCGNDGVTFQMRQRRYFQIPTGSIF